MENSTDNNYLSTPLDNSEQPAKQYKDAGLGKRFLNHLIDGVIYYIIIIVISFILGMTGTSEILVDSQFNLYAFVVVIYFLYYLILESTMGATIGKLITGTQVVTEDGNKPKWGTIAKRTLCRFIPFEPLSFFNGISGWHDRISDTRVVLRHR